MKVRDFVNALCYCCVYTCTVANCKLQTVKMFSYNRYQYFIERNHILINVFRKRFSFSFHFNLSKTNKIRIVSHGNNDAMRRAGSRRTLHRARRRALWVHATGTLYCAHYLATSVKHRVSAAYFRCFLNTASAAALSTGVTLSLMPTNGPHFVV